MSPRPASRAHARTVALLLCCSALVACSDPTSADGDRPPGRRVLATPELSEWRWLPSGDEIVFSTPFDYPYTGPPTRLDAVSASSGARRTIVAAPTDGSQVIAYRFEAVGTHVYYGTYRASTQRMSLLRAPIAGGGTPEVVLDPAPYKVATSPDERTFAWVERAPSGLAWMLATQDIASGARHLYPLAQPGDRVTWSPTSRGVVVDLEGAWVGTGTPFQWVALPDGAVRVFLAPANEFTSASSRDIGWEGDSPFLYSAGPTSVVRWSIASGVRETLGTLPPATLESATIGVGWSRDFETVVTATNTCTRWATGPFGGDCIRYSSHVDRLAWRSGARASVLRLDGPSAILGLLSPNGKWLAYFYGSCGGGCYGPRDGVYVVPVP